MKTCKLQVKTVTFDLTRNTIHETFSKDDYDRSIISCILYLKTCKRVSNEEWSQLWMDLNDYKCNEMVVDKASIYNTKLH